MEFGRFKIGMLELIIVVGLFATLGTLAIENDVFTQKTENYVQEEQTCQLIDSKSLYSHQLNVCLVPVGDGLWKEYHGIEDFTK